MNPKIKNYLDRLAASPKKPHSFLFIGPEETGKEKAAFYFIAKIAGKDGDEGFFEKMKAENHPDVTVIGPETEEKKGKTREKEIEIGQVRKIRERLKYFSYELEQKFCLVKKANRLNQKSSNALLKILEEPTKNTFFILLADSADNLLPTIVSRSAVLRFPLMSDGEIKKWLDGRGKGDAGEGIRLWSGGRRELVELLAEDKSLLLEKENRRERFRRIFSEELFETLDYVEKESKDRNRILEIFGDWETVLEASLRKLMEDAQKNRGKIAKVVFWIGEIRETINRIKNTNANPRTAAEKLVLDISLRIEKPSLK